MFSLRTLAAVLGCEIQVREWQQEQCHMAMTNGYVSSLLGRRLHVEAARSGALETPYDHEQKAKSRPLRVRSSHIARGGHT